MEVWILWCKYAADWPRPEHEVIDGVYAAMDLVTARIDELKKLDPYFISYRFQKYEVKK